MRGILAAAAALTLAVSAGITAPEATSAANVRTITGYTADGELHWEMSEIFQGGYCSASSGNICEPVEYLSGVPLVGEFSGLTVLTVALWSAPSPTTVLGFSQGALIATEWLRRNNTNWLAPSSKDLSFVLVANPLRKYGGVRPAYEIDDPTPATRYQVLDITIEYDGVSDFPDYPSNLLAVANALAGSYYIHIGGYEHVDLENAEKLVWKEGNTTYVLIRSQNIPLLEPLRALGLDPVADALNAPLKALIDFGYNRRYSGLVRPDAHDSVLQQFSQRGTAAAVSDAEPVATTATASAANRPSAVAESPQEPAAVLPEIAEIASAESPEGPESPATPDPSGSTEDPGAATDAEAEPPPTGVDEAVEDEAVEDGAVEDEAVEDEAESDLDSRNADSSVDLEGTDSGAVSSEAESLREEQAEEKADAPERTPTTPSGESEPTSESSNQ